MLLPLLSVPNSTQGSALPWGLAGRRVTRKCAAELEGLRGCKGNLNSSRLPFMNGYFFFALLPPVPPGFNLLLFLFFDALNHDSESPSKKAGVRRRAACCRVNLEGLHWEGG